MISHKATVTVNKSAAQVFQFVGTDYFVNHAKWDPRVVNLHLQTKGPVVLGTKGHEVRNEGGRNKNYDFEVTDFQTNQSIGMKAKGGSSRFSATYTIKPMGAQQSSLDVEFNLKMGGLRALMERFMAGGFRKEVDSVAASIKETLEK